MQTITVVFTKRAWNPVSWFIRWCMPRSRFHLARSSHCLIQDGDNYIEATMLHGVRSTDSTIALKGQTIIEVVDYEVVDAQVGIEWLRTQIGKSYDFKGAIGIALSPDREWAKEGWWFCYELAAATLTAAGRKSFRSKGYITEHMLLGIRPLLT